MSDPNAVELTAGQAWLIAERTGAGSYPWVLAVTPPCRDAAERVAFEVRELATLDRLGIASVTAGAVAVDSRVARWVHVVCRAAQWLELRFVTPASTVLRGVVARRGTETVVALRAGELLTLSSVGIDHPHALVPVLTAGLQGRPPAGFDSFALPAQAGARADERIRSGAALPEILDFLGVPASAHEPVTAAFGPHRSYVEIVAGEHRDGHRVSTDVGIGIVDTPAGRLLVSPSKAPDGQWISTFAPGTPDAIAVAVTALTRLLPTGAWFADVRLTRDFTTANNRTEHRCSTIP